jgi:hypothetical protein
VGQRVRRERGVNHSVRVAGAQLPGRRAGRRRAAVAARRGTTRDACFELFWKLGRRAWCFGRDGNVGGDVGSIGSATSKTQKYPHSPKTFAKKPPAAGFKAALKIPGVVTFSLCLFFTKLVAYTFLYWLPFYIERTEIGGVYLTPAQAGRLSTLFDIGGVAGGAFVFEFFESSDCSCVADGDYLRQKQHDPLASNRRRTRPHHHVLTTSVTFPVTNKYPTTPPPKNKKVFSPGTSATNSTRAP